MGTVEFYLRYLDGGRVKYIHLGDRYGDVEEVCPLAGDLVEVPLPSGISAHYRVISRSWNMTLTGPPVVRVVLTEADELFADDGEYPDG